MEVSALVNFVGVVSVDLVPKEASETVRFCGVIGLVLGERRVDASASAAAVVELVGDCIVRWDLAFRPSLVRRVSLSWSSWLRWVKHD